MFFATVAIAVLISAGQADQHGVDGEEACLEDSGLMQLKFDHTGPGATYDTTEKSARLLKAARTMTHEMIQNLAPELRAKIKAIRKKIKLAEKAGDLFCLTVGKSTSTCGKCIQRELHGVSVCRWCPASQSCQPAVFASDHGMSDTCAASYVGINSANQCSAMTYPYQIGDFLSKRPASAEQWAIQSAKTFDLPLHEFPTYPGTQTGLFDLSSGLALSDARGGSAATAFRVSFASDWGSGTGEAAVVASLMAQTSPGLTMHLGDVYWVGTPEQFRTNVFGQAANKNQIGVTFPKGEKATFLLNGNHEMISGGTGLMEDGFNYTGQQATFAAYQSDSWRFINLDTAYLCYGAFPGPIKKHFTKGARNLANETDAPQMQAVIDWLQNVVKIGDPEDHRGIVFLSHHQPYSAWEDGYLGTPKQLNELLAPGKEVVWFFGHEHRLAFYKKMILSDGTWTADFAMHGRMIGNGGFSDFLSSPETTANLVAYDNRTYQSIPQFPFAPVDVGFNGFVEMLVNGSIIEVSYITGKCGSDGCDQGYDTEEGTVVATERFTVDLENGELSQEWINLSNDLVNTSSGAGSETATARPSSPKASWINTGTAQLPMWAKSTNTMD